ncbi:tetratricopeptide repeat protein [Clostridium sp. 001]|uniref:tetratricopeptide repeat protein n=1 Tax=Clostridium sp. 001 TaxID=1970093 RepID=UPI001C2C793E|nr:tetratricopeptide repeat protein [Clostridium sp. 001]QXE18509.1 capsular biosynthesis protein [Clostridium sp. 001]
MDIKSHFAEKLSKLLFVEVNEKSLEKIFKVTFPEYIYLPLSSKNIVDNVKIKNNMDRIPIGYFIEGMFYVLGADENFKFSKQYKSIITGNNEYIRFIKGIIAKNVKNKEYEDAYILLKGLSTMEDSIEIYDKLIAMVDEIRKTNKIYKEEELQILKRAESKENYALPYLYESLIKREEGDYEKALFYINNYVGKGGKETLEITDMKEELKSIVHYDRGKELLEDNPEEALKLLIPLMDTFGDNASLYYYIAVGYRKLENYEKAIYYLNDALNIDSSIVEIVNEMGINYASIGDYEKAIAYLRKAFEATRSVEICTNLIMCYLDSGNLQDAKKHLEIAKKIDPKDEVVIEIDNFIKKIEKK